MTQNELKAIVAAELKKRTPLSDIQKLLADDHNYKMTFLDLRILASELEEVIESIANEDSAAEALAKEEQLKAKEAEDSVETALESKTIVEISKLARPGSIANGTVKFASGASAEWVLDHYGRLGLDKSQGKPTENDLKEFQAELQKALSHGM